MNERISALWQQLSFQTSLQVASLQHGRYLGRQATPREALRDNPNNQRDTCPRTRNALWLEYAAGNSVTAFIVVVCCKGGVGGELSPSHLQTQFWLQNISLSCTDAIPSCHVSVLVLSSLASLQILFVYQCLDAFLKVTKNRVMARARRLYCDVLC